jgi:hypothetical protein
MTFAFPVIELVDRYTIARVKYKKTNGANSGATILGVYFNSLVN